MATAPSVTGGTDEAIVKIVSTVFPAPFAAFPFAEGRYREELMFVSVMLLKEKPEGTVMVGVVVPLAGSVNVPAFRSPIA